jgi:hypothetical protein
LSSTPFRKHDEISLRIAAGAGLVAIVAAAVGLTHLHTAPEFAHPGRACLVLAVVLFVPSVATFLKLALRRRNARRLSLAEDSRLSPGQRQTKYDRGVTLGQHLFDIEADRIPDGFQGRQAWLAGRTVGPAEERGSDESKMVGIYQAADSLPLYGQRNEGNRHFLLIFGLAVLAMTACTLLLA